MHGGFGGKTPIKKNLEDLVVDKWIIEGVGHFPIDRGAPGPRCLKGVLYTTSQRV
jgi:hypothetical protein